MELTNDDLNLIVANYQAVKKSWTGTEFLSVQKYAINQLADTIYPFYLKFMMDNNALIEKHVEFDETSKQPKFKAQIASINSTELPPKEFLFKSEMDKVQYHQEYADLLKEKTDIPIKTYPINDLLETKAKINEVELYSLIRFVEA